MCLYVDSKEKECKVADCDITVYKYVAKRIKLTDVCLKSMHGAYTKDFELLHQKQTEFVWVSPYCKDTMKIEYKPGETVTDKQFESVATKFYPLSEVYGIFNGLHTFANESSAKDRACNFTTIDGWTGVLECVIPAGTRYWTNDNEYCSESLRVEKLVFQSYESDLKDFLKDFINSNE